VSDIFLFFHSFIAYVLDHLCASLNDLGLLKLPYPLVAGMNLENTEGGRFTSGASDLAMVALPTEAPHLGSRTSP